MSKLRTSLTYANVMATMAFFLALSGGIVYAADKIGSSEIAKGAIKSKHVKDDSLTGVDIKEASLSLPAAARGPVGPAGEPGAPGDPGAPGAPGATNVVYRQATDNSGSPSVDVSCLPGEVATGGGASSSQPGVFIYSSQPFSSTGTIPDGWTARAELAGGGAPNNVTAFVVCASP